MLLFVANDPGAKNHIRPIYDYAACLGETAEFIDLSSSKELMDDDRASSLVQSIGPNLLISGCSINRGEWPLVRACKRSGVRTVMMVDIGAAGKFDAVSPTDFPDRFMVTNEGCRDELVCYGAEPDTIEITGSAHLELLLSYKPEKSGPEIYRDYQLESGDPLVSFFCTPYIDDAIEAVSSLAMLLPATQLERPAVIVRPHPRSPNPERLDHVCRQFGFVHFDPGNSISTPALLLASCMSFAMTSTVALESMVLGTPSAFYQIGWNFHQPDRRYGNVASVLRIRDAAGLNQFVEAALDKRGTFIPGNVERYQGAMGRIWQVISQRTEYP